MPRKAKPRVKAGTNKQSAAKRREEFPAAYLANNRNGTRAVISLGFSEKGAAVQASRYLKDPKIAAEIERLAEEQGKNAGLTTERVLREIERISFSDVRRFLNPDGTMKPIHELDDDCAAALAAVEIDSAPDGEERDAGRRTGRLKLWDKNTALEKAMKHLGLYERDNKQRGDNLAIQVVLVK